MTIDDEIIEHEVRRDKYQQMQKPKVMQAIPAPRIRNEEEKKEPPLIMMGKNT